MRMRTTLAVPRSRTRWSRSATAPRSRAPSASGAAITSRCCSRPSRLRSGFPTDAEAVERTGELADTARVRPDPGARLPLPGLLGPRRARDRRPRPRLQPAFEAALRTDANGAQAKARARLDEELALIDELGLAGFFLLHWEVLELAADVAREVRGRESPRHSLPPGRGRGSSVGSLVCYLTGLSHVDPVAAGLSLGRFLNRELDSVPDIDLDFPRDIREKLIVALTERYGHEHAALVASFSTYRSRGAIRDLGKALGLPFAELERLARITDGEPETHRRGDREASRRRDEAPLAALARPRASCRARSPASRATSPSTRAGWSSRAARSWSSSRYSPRPWRGARSASGTRTRAPTRAS